jgi:phosphonoacetate hydrolase
MTNSGTRRRFLASTLAFPALAQARPQRVVLFMCDGLGPDYATARDMPVLARWGSGGIRKTVRGVMPSVTNANNASICCGAWPGEHGITANFYLDEKSGREEYMEDAALVLRPTLFQRAAARGVKSALLSSKKKTTSLLCRGAEVVMTAEAPTPEWTARLGPAPNIYSAEINHWLLRAGIWLLRNRRDLGVLYVHTTDYPMHMWPPEAPESKRHLARLDALFGEMRDAAPDAAFLLTADHGMHHKSRCWDLEKVCRARGATVRAAISAEQDKYLKHHRGFGGTAWVYLHSPRDAGPVTRVIAALPGVESVLTRAEAAARFHLMPSRIGELVVLGDPATVFGELDTEQEALPPEYRSHGAVDDTEVPLVVFNAHGAPSAGYFQHNFDLARWLFRA